MTLAPPEKKHLLKKILQIQTVSTDFKQLPTYIHVCLSELISLLFEAMSSREERIHFYLIFYLVAGKADWSFE